MLVDICLSVFIQQTQCGKIVALDKAHNYMTEGSGAAKAFTEKLLRTVREQRHQAVRVVTVLCKTALTLYASDDTVRPLLA